MGLILSFLFYRFSHFQPLFLETASIILSILSTVSLICFPFLRFHLFVSPPASHSSLSLALSPFILFFGLIHIPRVIFALFWPSHLLFCHLRLDLSVCFSSVFVWLSFPAFCWLGLKDFVTDFTNSSPSAGRDSQSDYFRWTFIFVFLYLPNTMRIKPSWKDKKGALCCFWCTVLHCEAFLPWHFTQLSAVMRHL